MFKKWSATALLFFLLLIQFGPTCYFTIKKTRIKDTIENLWETIGLDNDNELVNLTFHKDEINSLLRWEHNKEFEYNGKMYDVHSSFTLADSITYLCYFDKDETELNQKIAEYQEDVNNANPENTSSQKKIIDLLEEWYIDVMIKIDCIFHFKTTIIQELMYFWFDPLGYKFIHSLLKPPQSIEFSA